MTSNKIVVGIVVVVALCAVAYAFQGSIRSSYQSQNVPICTADAMMCPDGSYVGRTGPDCQFICPETTAVQSYTAQLNQRISINGTYITPLQVVDDSRCAEDVQCIWAGQVRLKVKLEGSSSEELTLVTGIDTVFEGKHIYLVSVSPNKNSKKTISPNEYSFTFSIK